MKDLLFFMFSKGGNFMPQKKDSNYNAGLEIFQNSYLADGIIIDVRTIYIYLQVKSAHRKPSFMPRMKSSWVAAI